MKKFSHIVCFFRSKKTCKLFLGLVVFGLSTSVYAESEFNGDFINNILDVVNVLNMMIAMLTAPAAILAGWLLTPDWTFGDFFGLREYLYEIWVLVSNIVYIIFAILLLWMAANGIFHPDDEFKYVFKKRLPAFLVGILMVPFTWFIVSFTLTMVNKGIAVVMSVPMGTIVSVAGSGDDASAWNYRVIPTLIQIDFGEEGGAHGSSENLKCNSEGSAGTENPCISPAEFLGNNRAGPFYMIMIYAYDIFKIQNADFVDKQDLCNQAGDNNDSCIRTLTGVLSKLLFNVIWAFFFSILLIALAVVLLYRAFLLWIYIMFSPMFGLAVFFGKFDGAGVSDKIGFKQFFTLALIPLMVACILSFGLLFIGVIRDNPGQGGAPLFAQKNGSQAQCTNGTWTVKYCFEPDSSQEYRSYIVIGGNGQQSTGGEGSRGSSRGGSEEYSITFDFGPVFSDLIDQAAGTTAGTVTTEAAGAVGSVQDIFSYAIMNTIALVIIWIAVIAAIKQDKVLEGVIKPFENFGQQIGSAAKQLPGLIPIPGTNGLKVGSINTALGTFSGAMSSTARDAGRIAGESLAEKAKLTPNKFRSQMDGFNELNDSQKTNSQLASRISSSGDRINFTNKDDKELLLKNIEAARKNEPGAREITDPQREKVLATSSREGFAKALQDVGISSDVVEAVRNGVDGTSPSSDTQSSTTNKIDIKNSNTVDVNVSDGKMTVEFEEQGKNGTQSREIQITEDMTDQAKIESALKSQGFSKDAVDKIVSKTGAVDDIQEGATKVRQANSISDTATAVVQTNGSVQVERGNGTSTTLNLNEDVSSVPADDKKLIQRMSKAQAQGMHDSINGENPDSASRFKEIYNEGKQAGAIIS